MRQYRDSEALAARGKERACHIAVRLGMSEAAVYRVWRNADRNNGLDDSQRKTRIVTPNAKKAKAHAPPRGASPTRVVLPTRPSVPGRDPRFKWSLHQIGVFGRTANCLEERGYFTVGQILAARPEELLTIPNFGRCALQQLMSCLARCGFRVPTRYVPNDLLRHRTTTPVS